MNRVSQHLYVLEAVFLMSGPRVSMMEYRAVTGTWPSSNERAAFSAPSAEKANPQTTGVIRDGGAVDYTMRDRANDLAGRVLSIRAWQSPGVGETPVAWLCGHARAMAMSAASVDRTTLSDAELPSPCRTRN
jgi:type IV pilus assembly protein PilA